MRRPRRQSTLLALICGSFLFGGTFTCRSDDDDDDFNDNRATSSVVVVSMAHWAAAR